MSEDIYAVVCDNDGGHDPDGPLIFEQYTHNADLESIKKRRAYLEGSGRYGKCRIAKLEFIDE